MIVIELTAASAVEASRRRRRRGRWPGSPAGTGRACLGSRSTRPAAAPANTSCCAPSVVRKTSGGPPTPWSRRRCRRAQRARTDLEILATSVGVLDTATSSGFAGARPSDTRGHTGTLRRPENVDVARRVALVTVPPRRPAVPPPSHRSGRSAQVRRWERRCADERAGRARLDEKHATPSESTVFSASTRNPFASPVRTSVIAKTTPVRQDRDDETPLRHCRSRSAASSITVTLPTPGRNRHARTSSSTTARRRRRVDHPVYGWTPACWVRASTPTTSSSTQLAPAFIQIGLEVSATT